MPGALAYMSMYERIPWSPLDPAIPLGPDNPCAPSVPLVPGSPFLPGIPVKQNRSLTFETNSFRRN